MKNIENTINNTPISLIMLGLLALLGYSSFFIIQLTNRPLSILPFIYGLVFIIILYKRFKTQKTNIPYIEIVIYCLALLFIIFLHTKQYYGLWDAWAQWTPKALFLGQGTNNWKSVFLDEIEYTHPGYPLLSPSIKATIGASSPYFYHYSILVSSLFSWLYIRISGELLHSASNKRIPRYTSLLLFFTPGFIPWIASQYTDITLGCFVAATATCYIHTPMKNRFKFIGFFLGAVLFTKDEGLMYVFYFIFAAIAVESLNSKHKKTNWKSLSITFFPGLAALLLVKMQSQINDVLHNAPNQLMELSGLKIVSVVHFMSQYLLTPTKFLIIFPAFVMAWIIFFLRGKRNTNISFFMAIFIASSLLGMAITYSLTYLSLRYHIEHSVDRLVLQFLPIIMGFIATMAFPLNEQVSKHHLRNNRV